MPLGATTAAADVPGVLSLAGFDAVHGFTTRAGGVSSGDYATLNLGLSSGDDRAAVERNRDILLSHIGVDRDQVCAFNQVHGDRVLVGRRTWFEEDADAAISDRPDLLLVVSAADCFPVLFHDPISGAVGAAHCGWRGSAARLAANVVVAMQHEYGTRPADLRVAVGPGIRGACYQVSPEVAARFVDAGFPEGVVVPDRATSADAGSTEPAGSQAAKYLLDIEAAIAATLTDSGVAPTNIAWLGRCTHCEPAVFYSHRRDAGRTGRLWGFVRATAPATATAGASANSSLTAAAGPASEAGG